jgi:signal peptidase II
MRLTLISALFWFLLDQLSKTSILYWMNLAERGNVAVLPPYLNFRLGWNTGVNFGLFAGNGDTTRWILVAVALIISVWVLWWAKTGLTRKLALLSAGAIVGGALGNALDRVIYGAVVDFLNTTCCGFSNPYTFNLADVGIFAGAAGLLIFADAEKKTT